jgi:TRAP-type mannitol/chloroaromatic compound transport system permease small subunit
MKSFPQGLNKTIIIIDNLAEKTGALVSWLMIPLVAGLTYEVIARYAFNAPTIWAYDLAYMLYGSLFMLGAAFTLRRGGHIRTDVFYHNWSPKTRSWINFCCYLFLFFPGMIFFFVSGLENTLHSWAIREKSDYSPWRPPLYPFKTVVPLAALLLIIQGLSEFLKSLKFLLTGKDS